TSVLPSNGLLSTQTAPAASTCCCAPMDPPTTSAKLFSPNCSVTSFCCARTSSPMRTRGKFAMPADADVLCGEDERPRGGGLDGGLAGLAHGVDAVRDPVHMLLGRDRAALVPIPHRG